MAAMMTCANANSTVTLVRSSPLQKFSVSMVRLTRGPSNDMSATSHAADVTGFCKEHNKSLKSGVHSARHGSHFSA